MRPHHRSLLRAFLTHAVWSNKRLFDYGYAVDENCQFCGEPDSLFHRLFKCTCTQEVRGEFFSQEEVTWLEHSPQRAVLLQGLQLLPEDLGGRPPGIGSQPYSSWTLTGQLLSEVMQGQVFTDGSCFKYGAPTWSVAAWAVVKISEDGILLAWA